MKVLVRLFFALALMFCPTLMMGCGSSYVPEESTVREIEAEAQEEAQEADVVAESEEGDDAGSEEDEGE